MIRESFTFSIQYKNEERVFNAVLSQYGYLHRVTIPVGDIEVIFEPDEERNYRAVVPGIDRNNKEISPALLQAIAEKLVEIFN
jgi:hypothetical protein